MAYLDTGPERLLLGSLRLSLAGHLYEDCACFEAARSITAAATGEAAAEAILEAVTPTAELLWQLRGSGLRVYPYACRCLSRDECMMIAATAAAQHDDDEAMTLAVEGLLSRPTPLFTGLLSRGFCGIAAALEQTGARLQDVPCPVIAAIAAAEPSLRLH